MKNHPSLPRSLSFSLSQNFFLPAVLCVAGLLTVSPNTDAAVVTFYRGATNDFTTNYNGVKDTSTASNVSNNNFGAATTLYVGRNNGRSALILFDLSSLAGQVNVNSATLTFQRTGAATAADFTISLYSMFDTNAGWVEGTGDGNAPGPTGSATYSSFAYDPQTSTQWKNADNTGIANITSTYGVSTLISSQTYTTTTTELSFAIPIEIITEWINSPSANAGLILVPTGSTVNNMIASFGSSEDALFGNRPALTLDYTVVPEPATAMYLLFGGMVAFLAGRRREAHHIPS